MMIGVSLGRAANDQSVIVLAIMSEAGDHHIQQTLDRDSARALGKQLLDAAEKCSNLVVVAGLPPEVQ